VSEKCLHESRPELPIVSLFAIFPIFQPKATFKGESFRRKLAFLKRPPSDSVGNFIPISILFSQWSKFAVALSMTGFGEASAQIGGLSIAVEIRSVNNRFLKVIPTVPEALGPYVPQVEALVRQRARRGTIQVFVRLERSAELPRFRINEAALEAYRFQLESLRARWGFQEPLRLETLLSLPGVVEPVELEKQPGLVDWAAIEGVLSQALDQWHRARQEEGATMVSSLAELCQKALEILGQIEARTPQTVAAYQQRLQERLRQLLAAAQLQAEEVDIVREVALFADRVDIGEEIVRLRGHLNQFLSLLSQPDCSGRQLDFLAQEMHREASTIGAKAADAQISQWVVQIKTLVERIREIVQNLE
jgi:uncharacterized protein (TIGR00255 family)